MEQGWWWRRMWEMMREQQFRTTSVLRGSNPKHEPSEVEHKAFPQGPRAQSGTPPLPPPSPSPPPSLAQAGSLPPLRVASVGVGLRGCTSDGTTTEESIRRSRPGDRTVASNGARNEGLEYASRSHCSGIRHA